MIQQTVIRQLAMPVLLLLLGLWGIQAVGLLQGATTDDGQFARRANLALRLAADRLLDLAGDSTATIPPVEQRSANEYLLRLESNFNYDSLPGLFARAFAQHGIHEDYNVVVADCFDSSKFMLGYSAADLAKDDVPCGGREQQTGCYNIIVTFPGLRAGAVSQPRLLGAAALFVSLAVLTFLVFYLKKKKNEPAVEVPADQADDSHLVRFGNSHFDPSNQRVTIHGVQQSLTYREAKLLHHFLRNANQVLERERILESVWGDEGIIVGRSLDVFVSRLRKILQKEDAVKIVNVHGVGYRMELA